MYASRRSMRRKGMRKHTREAAHVVWEDFPYSADELHADMQGLTQAGISGENVFAIAAYFSEKHADHPDPMDCFRRSAANTERFLTVTGAMGARQKELAARGLYFDDAEHPGMGAYSQFFTERLCRLPLYQEDADVYFAETDIDAAIEAAAKEHAAQLKNLL